MRGSWRRGWLLLSGALVVVCLSALSGRSRHGGTPTLLAAPAAPAASRDAGAAPRPAFAAPVSGGRVISPFGWREGPGGRREFHAGVDVEADEGAPVRALAAGVVREVGWEPGGYGRFVVLRHEGGWETLYAHAGRVLVAGGEAVRAGQPVARAGRSGNATAAHLHLEVRRHGLPLDPEPYLDLGGSR